MLTHNIKLLSLRDLNLWQKKILMCKATNCGPNPKGIGNRPNKLNTINL